jgi:hypothetical protein
MNPLQQSPLQESWVGLVKTPPGELCSGDRAGNTQRTLQNKLLDLLTTDRSAGKGE